MNDAVVEEEDQADDCGGRPTSARCRPVTSLHSLTDRGDVEDARPYSLAVHLVDSLVLSDVFGDKAELGQFALLGSEPLARGGTVLNEEPRDNADAHGDDSFDPEDGAPAGNRADRVDLEDARSEQAANGTGTRSADDVACLQ